MDLQGIPQLFILVAFITANIPWLSDRFLVVFSIRNKNGWLRWLEWLLLYGVVGLQNTGSSDLFRQLVTLLKQLTAFTKAKVWTFGHVSLPELRSFAP